MLQTGGLQQKVHPDEDEKSNRQFNKGCSSYHAANML